MSQAKLHASLVFFLVGIGTLGCASTSNQRKPAAEERPKIFTAFTDNPAQCVSYSDEISDNQKKVIYELMATHEHRLYHFMWHATRNSWSDLSPDEQDTLKSMSPSWGKHTPVCPMPERAIESSDVSPAGEEFLLMHHEMVASLQKEMIDRGLPCIAGWSTLPKKDDRLFPIPSVRGHSVVKSDEHGARMDAWVNQLRDPEFLVGKSLSYIGVLVEFTLHNQMHMRWATAPREGDSFTPMSRAFLAADLLAPSRFDEPKFQWLGNPYSAHVNPIFWKLHGWVDDVIPLWLRANGYDTIAKDCQGAERCYSWKSIWTGPSMAHHHEHDHGRVPQSETPSMTEEQKKRLNGIFKKISVGAGFENSRFELAPRSQGGELGTPKGGEPLYDAEEFLKKYGPCS